MHASNFYSFRMVGNKIDRNTSKKEDNIVRSIINNTNMLHLSLSTATWRRVPYLAAHAFLVQCEEKKLAMAILRWSVYWLLVSLFCHVRTYVRTWLPVQIRAHNWMYYSLWSREWCMGMGYLVSDEVAFKEIGKTWRDLRIIHPAQTGHRTVIGSWVLTGQLWSKRSSNYNKCKQSNPSAQ